MESLYKRTDLRNTSYKDFKGQNMAKKKYGSWDLQWAIRLVAILLCAHSFGVTWAYGRRSMFPGDLSLALNEFRTEEEAAARLVDILIPKYLEMCPEACLQLMGEYNTGCANSHHRESQMMTWQLSSDVLIALAYFSIPIELLFFIYKTRVFPYKWVVAQFGAFIVLCGLTHLINVWVFTFNSEASFVAMTFFKVITATVSCATAVTMLWVLPELLQIKTRELFFTAKTAELGKEVGKIRKEKEIGRHVQLLTHEIRSTLDRHTILHTTLVELARTLNLVDTGIWMPNLECHTMELMHEVESLVQTTASVPMSDETIQTIFSSTGAVVISQGSDLARLTCCKSCEEILDGHVAAVRLPLLTTTHFNRNSAGLEGVMPTEGELALLVLAIPNDGDRFWGGYELDLVNSVAAQVAVALSHAAVLEEAMRIRNQLLAQNAELQQARLEVEQAMATRNEFLAVMNHEMRTPMHAIIALSSLLTDTELSSDQKHMVQTLTRSSGLLQTLIDDFLDFSKLEIGKLSLCPDYFEFPALCKEAESILKPMALSKSLGFDWILTRVPAKILGDSKRILQILLNVIGNAIKFTTTGHVHVSAYMGSAAEAQPAGSGAPTSTKIRSLKVQYKYLHVDVQDTGIGISATHISRLFNKFIQADSSTTRQFGGTGLGLAICKKFVELMGGSIAIESKGTGMGSTCRVRMCVGVVDDSSGDSAASVDSVKKFSKETQLPNVKVLVVDDNEVNRMVTGKLLKRLGCKTLVLESGAECLKVLSERGPSAFDVLLLDLCMPEMDGFMVANEIIKTYGQDDRPLIAALTANADLRTRERVFEVGMDSILLKPITVGKLRQEILKLLQLADDSTKD